MKLGRLNHIGVATPSIADSVVDYRAVVGVTKIHAPQMESYSACDDRHNLSGGLEARKGGG